MQPRRDPQVSVPRRLRAPEPGWTTTADVIVVGSGIAGLTTALRLRRRVDRVLLVTKTRLEAGSTAWAQGGIAAVMSPEDSPAEHIHDTLVAGVGLCDPEAVRTLVEESGARLVGASVLVDKATPETIDELGVRWLVGFDELGR